MQRAKIAMWRLHIIAVAVLLAGSLLTLTDPSAAYVAGARAVAAAPSLAQSPLEQFYNPFGDPWELKRPANPDTPVALTPACHRYEPMRSIGPTADQIQWLSRSNSRLIFEECAELADITDGQGATKLKTFVTALKAADPSLVFVGYFTAGLLPTAPGMSAAAVDDGVPIGLAYIDANQESWFVHKKGTTVPDRANRLRHSSSFAEVLDMTNPSLRQYLATQLAQSMTFHGVDGVAIDGCYDLPRYNQSIPGNVPPDEVLSGWANGCATFLAELKAAAPSKLIFTLNYWSLVGQQSSNHEAYDYEWFTRRMEVADGIFWEDPIGVHLYTADEVQRNIERLAARAEYARQRNKYLGVILNTNVGNQASFSSTNAQQQQTYAHYYFAAYLVAFDGPKTVFIPYTPTQALDQFNSAAFFKVWDASVGLPTGARQNVSPGVYRRDFQRGRAYLNGSYSPLNISIDDGLWLTSDGAPVRSATIQPKTGAIFVQGPGSQFCSPRPRINTQTRSLGGGAIEVQISGGLGDFRRIDIGQAPNTLVSMQGGPQQVSSGQSISMPVGSRSAVFTLQRVNGGGGTFAQMTVVDSCGEWKTFAGRGIGA